LRPLTVVGKRLFPVSFHSVSLAFQMPPRRPVWVVLKGMYAPAHPPRR
jgi:hypothetical protein